MIRYVLLHYVLPLVLPFVIYGVWLLLARRKARTAGGEEAPEWRDAPWTWLFVAGAALVAVGLVGLALTGGAPPGGEYVPPKYIDGEVVPGRLE